MIRSLLANPLGTLEKAGTHRSCFHLCVQGINVFPESCSEGNALLKLLSNSFGE